MNDAREKGRGGLTIPGGPGLVSAALVFEAILDSKTGSAALNTSPGCRARSLSPSRSPCGSWRCRR